MGYCDIWSQPIKHHEYQLKKHGLICSWRSGGNEDIHVQSKYSLVCMCQTMHADSLTFQPGPPDGSCSQSHREGQRSRQPSGTSVTKTKIRVKAFIWPAHRAATVQHTTSPTIDLMGKSRRRTICILREATQSDDSKGYLLYCPSCTQIDCSWTYSTDVSFSTTT